MPLLAPTEAEAEETSVDLAVTVAGTGPLGLHVDIVRDPLAPEDAGLLLPPQSPQQPQQQQWSPFGKILIRSVDPTGAVAQGLRAAARAAQEEGRGARFPVRHLGQLAGAAWTGP